MCNRTSRQPRDLLAAFTIHGGVLHTKLVNGFVATHRIDTTRVLICIRV